MSTYKTTLTIYSYFNPFNCELTELAREAEQGEAICDELNIEIVEDSDLPEGVASFFQVGDQ